MSEDDEHRYPKRHRSAPIRYGIDEYVDAAFLGATNEEEPKSIEEALKNKIWKEAADCEYQSLMDNETWELVNLPSGRKPNGFLRLNAQVRAKWSGIKLDSWQRVILKNQEKIMMRHSLL